ncbi:Tox-REase-5 domain-containing protein [Pyxidicoccus caerfyrddinensis]|uniref:Tox-REase-5 domain-containing protein n=1 Tax=Pyxidicoccus caerfyrddinensis TaxID=2709663 RepID=UPI0023DDA48D|nr:Tox-REase-5 domain-containing protein [Pyxidicoccus caerfyrddinensis]
MRADSPRVRWARLLLAAALLTTGCASMSPSPVQGMNLGYSPRAAATPTQAEGASAKPQSTLPSSMPPPGERERMHRRRESRAEVTRAGPERVAGNVGGVRGDAREDAWEKLLTDAGLEAPDERPLPNSPLTPAHAARLLKMLLRKPVTLGTFPARMAVGALLREVLEGGELSRDELVRRVERFTRVAVLRPDGYLAWVRTGRTQQRAAAVEWKDGAFRAGPFELGRFYVSNGSVFRLADEQLEPMAGPVLVEVYDDADYLGRSLDGAEAAFLQLALSLGQFFTRPLDSLAALKDLPAGVVALIAASPEYFERFRYMTRGEQVRAVAELVTNLVVTTGAASATTRTVTGALAGAEATVPALSLSAQGALTIDRVAVPVGRAAAVLGGGPGAAIILQRANSAAGEASPSGGRGPGEWGPSEEKGAPPRARAYQEQISGHSYDEAYWVGGVGRKSGGTKFDGYRNGALLEAKGPGYAEFFDEKFVPKEWFKLSEGAVELVRQAKRQSERVKGMGIPIEWHVAEKHAAKAIWQMLQDAEVVGITVIHTPAL